MPFTRHDLWRAWPALAGLGAALLCQPAESVTQLRLLDSISGEGLMAVQAALPELARRGLTPEGYKITVWRVGRDRVSVLFEQSADRASLAADGQRKPNLSVQLGEEQLPLMWPARPR
jgi:hypothetical protein